MPEDLRHAYTLIDLSVAQEDRRIIGTRRARNLDEAVSILTQELEPWVIAGHTYLVVVRTKGGTGPLRNLTRIFTMEVPPVPEACPVVKRHV